MSKNKEKTEEVTKIGEVGFRDVHPSETAGKNPMVPGKDLPDYMGTKGNESRWTRCKQCGFILDADRVARGSGYGNITYSDVSGYSGTDNFDPVVTIGCPFCGASEW